MEEVGFQAVETDSKLFEHSNASGNLIFKCDTNENTKNTVSDRVPVPEITDQINIKIEPEEVKVESCLDNSEKYSVLEIMEEFVIKDECNDDDMFLGTTTETVSNSTLKQKTMVKQQSVACKKLSKNLVYCHSCNYSARSKYILVSHMKEHRDLKKHNNVQGSSYKHNTCIHCNAKYSCKMTLDNHVMRKHSDLVASVSSKTHECSHCAYKTTIKSSYRKHMLKHSKTAKTVDKSKSGICIHCKAKFKAAAESAESFSPAKSNSRTPCLNLKFLSQPLLALKDE
ncbi:unnamed protein product [Acanthoscelides obtectus]|uniref:C2H2-type domain-containing protein n=1 Tax=Acanthoscelides obtectus TaxID=200917 RepID=A0A9P0KRD8_ACAOB|nr:unnamed protein product [Acanthoscelides obtectus]CAK1665151.1 hypothetical protein AOBTE_LOCUS24684 [Acanthoscelides obtectus]